jgi:uncharacterized protein YqjF (DUF2071 family)
LQEFDGSAWLGVVPFRMQAVMRRPLPDLPFVSAFPELNVRTYVEHDGKPGVWFLSLDATNALAVYGGRRWFGLPYHKAEIAITAAASGRFDYRLVRGRGLATFDGSYWPTGEVREAEPGTLEHFLVERYCLYAQNPSGRVARADVHHVPWPLQRAELELRENRMTTAFEIGLSGTPALLHFARRVDVVVWSPQPIASDA